jgi:hypothetical protein
MELPVTTVSARAIPMVYMIAAMRNARSFLLRMDFIACVTMLAPGLMLILAAKAEQKHVWQSLTKSILLLSIKTGL